MDIKDCYIFKESGKETFLHTFGNETIQSPVLKFVEVGCLLEEFKDTDSVSVCADDQKVPWNSTYNSNQ